MIGNKQTKAKFALFTISKSQLHDDCKSTISQLHPEAKKKKKDIKTSEAGEYHYDMGRTEKFYTID